MLRGEKSRLRPLQELAKVIPKGWRMPAKPTTPEGRNVALFRLGMRWCGYPRNWGNIEGVQAVIEAANAALDLPLVAGEVRGRIWRAGRRRRTSASSRPPGDGSQGRYSGRRPRFCHPLGRRGFKPLHMVQARRAHKVRDNEPKQMIGPVPPPMAGPRI